jgi:hypothetical protein
MFEIQRGQIEDVERSVREQAHHIINVVSSRPHSRLIDPERAISLVTESKSARDAKLAEKAKVREDADVEMADITIYIQVVQQTVREEVECAIKSAASSSSCKVSWIPWDENTLSDPTHIASSTEQEEKQECHSSHPDHPANGQERSRACHKSCHFVFIFQSEFGSWQRHIR